MNARKTPLSERDLHAYVDDELDVERRMLVGAWIDADPTARAKVAQWRAQNDALRRAWPAAPPPPREAGDHFFDDDLDPMAPQPANSSSSLRASLAWLAVVAGVGATLTLVALHDARLRRSPDEAASPPAVRVADVAALGSSSTLALAAWRTYGGAGAPDVEVGADSPAALRAFLQSLRALERAPDLGGEARLAGARKLPSLSGAVLYLLYEDAKGGRFALVAAPAPAGEAGVAAAGPVKAAFGDVSLREWTRGAIVWTLVGPFDENHAGYWAQRIQAAQGR